MNCKNINKAIMFTIVLIFILTTFNNASYATDDNISVYIDYEKIVFEINPILKEDRVLVPMRKIFEQLEAKVTWDEKTKSVYSEKEDIKIKLTIDHKVININGEDITMDIAPVLYEGTTLVPLRIISEAYGFQVNWISGNREVRITTNPVYVRNEDLKLDMGMSLEELISIMGYPSRVDQGQYNTLWYTYNNSPTTYKDYILLKVEDNKVRGFQTNSESWTISDIIKVNDEFNEIQLKKMLGEKHNENDYELDIYNYEVENTINSFSIVERTAFGFWEGDYSLERLIGLEKQVFDMTNVYRVNKNLEPLRWNNMISKFARNHSRDMMENDYFSHDSLTQSFQERIQPLLIGGDWDLGGENLGFGYLDSIIVMNGWYNSKGHRENLLYKDWKYHGVGIVNSESKKLYATQNFTE